MRYISSIVSVAALASIAAAGDAPVVEGNPIEITYSATIPQVNAQDLSGAVKISSAPDGEGVNIQVSLYNLPSGQKLNYGIYSGEVASLSDCSTAGAIFNPYGGFTGDKCASDKAGCAVGDLSDKYGKITVLGGGSGTGYFPANYLDKYLSMQPGDEAFFGKGSFVVTDPTGAYVACANFVNANNAASESKKAAHHATMTTASASASASAGASGSGSGSGGNSDSSDNSSNPAPRATLAPLLGAGVLGLAALVL